MPTCHYMSGDCPCYWVLADGTIFLDIDEAGMVAHGEWYGPYPPEEAIEEISRMVVGESSMDFGLRVREEAAAS